MEQYRYREHRERILKFALCIIVSAVVGALLGYPDSPTMVMTAVLCLHMDRGDRDMVTYGIKRVLTQLLMGGLVAVLLVYAARFTLPRWILNCLITVLAMALGLIVDYRHNFSPMAVALVTTVLIMVVGIPTDPWYLPRRVLFCLLGAVIALAISAVFNLPRDIWEETRERIATETRRRLPLSALSGEEAPSDPAPLLAYLQGRIAIAEQSRRAIRKHGPDGIARLRELHGALAALCRLRGGLLACGGRMSEPFRQAVIPLLEEAESAHLAALEGEPAFPPPVALIDTDLQPRCPADIHVAHHLLEYADALRAVGPSYAPAVCHGQIRCDYAGQKQG